MLPLIRMTWTLNRRVCLYVAPWILGMQLGVGLMAHIKEGNSAGLLFSAVMAGAVLSSLVTLQFAFVPLEGFLLSLPVTRAQVVRAHYLVALMAAFLGVSLLPLLVGVARFIAPQKVPPLAFETLGLLGVLVSGLVMGLFTFLPFLFRWGGPRGVTAFTLTLLLLLSATLWFKGLDGSLSAVLSLGNRVLDRPAFAAGCSAGLALFSGASLGISTWSYQKREF